MSHSGHSKSVNHAAKAPEIAIKGEPSMVLAPATKFHFYGFPVESFAQVEWPMHGE